MDQAKKLNLDMFLQPSVFCDSDSEIIRRAAFNINCNCSSEREFARKAFYWVRDNIKYELGLVTCTASETLKAGVGSCSNKANLLVALLRNRNIRAGFHVMDVKAKLYFGVFSRPVFSQFASDRSQHIYCSFKIEDNWIKVDPSDDIKLSNGIQHLCSQAAVVDFDGYKDALLKLDPQHILSIEDDIRPSVDDLLSKKRRLHPIVMRVCNLYMDFLRQNCIWHDTVESAEKNFFEYLSSHDHFTYAQFRALELQMKNVNPASHAKPVFQ